MREMPTVEPLYTMRALYQTEHSITYSLLWGLIQHYSTIKSCPLVTILKTKTLVTRLSLLCTKTTLKSTKWRRDDQNWNRHVTLSQPIKLPHCLSRKKDVILPQSLVTL
uniref:Uncharacterized protein n=2 Tax=Cacopsylla melanoneura TaxID=428564 RepID=A0A8D9B557_9HEMI